MLESPVTTIASIYKKIPKNLLVTFIGTFLLGSLIHMFMLTNKLPNSDDLWQTFSSMHYEKSGRWFLHIPAAVSSTYSMPWVSGILSFLYISISACLVVHTLKLKNILSSLLVGAIMCASPIVASTLTYMNTSDPYFMSLLLGCLAVYLSNRFKYGFILGGVSIALCMGIYQAYISVSASLMLAVLILEILRGELRSLSVLYKAIRFLSALIIGLVVYFIMVKVTAPVLTDYMGISSMGKIDISMLPIYIGDAYKYAFSFFFRNLYNFNNGIMQVSYTVIAIATLASIALITVVKKLYQNVFGIIMLVVFITLLPIGSNLVFLMNAGQFPHTLMVFGLLMLIVFCIAIFDNLAQLSITNKPIKAVTNISGWCVVISLAICIHGFAIVSNKVYFNLHFVYEQGYSYATRLLERIESTPGYSTEIEIAFYGRPDANFSAIPSADTELNGIAGAISELPKQFSFIAFINRYLGVKQKLHDASSPEKKPKFYTSELDNMPLYPLPGSVKVINNICYVKFTD